MEEAGQLDRRLAAEGDHHADGLFHPDDIPHVLRAERLEVQPVGGVVVGGDGLGVVIDDDHVIAHLPQRPDTMDAAVIEFNALSDADRPRAEHHDDVPAAAAEAPALAFLVEAGVEIGRLRVKLRTAGVHHLIAHGHARQRRPRAEAAQRGVRVAQALGLGVVLRGDAAALQARFKVRKGAQPVQKPAVDPGQRVKALHVHARLERFKQGEEPVVVLLRQPLFQGQVGQRRGVEAVESDLRAAHGLHERRLEVRGDRHDLARRLHLRAQGPAAARKFVERPFRQLHHHVVERRLEARAGFAGDVVGDLVEGVAERDARADLGDGIARGLGGQRRGAAHAGVDLDHRVRKAVRVQRELAVAAAYDPERGDDVQRRRAQHLVLPVRERQGGRHDKGIPRVDAHRVEVLHGADRDHVSRAVAHGLELDLLPACDALFHQDLVDRRLVEAASGDEAQSFLVRGDPAAAAAQGIGRAYDDRVADFGGDLQSRVQLLRRGGGDHRLPHGL